MNEKQRIQQAIDNIDITFDKDIIEKALAIRFDEPNEVLPEPKKRLWHQGIDNAVLVPLTEDGLTFLRIRFVKHKLRDHEISAKEDHPGEIKTYVKKQLARIMLIKQKEDGTQNCIEMAGLLTKINDAVYRHTDHNEYEDPDYYC